MTTYKTLKIKIGISEDAISVIRACTNAVDAQVQKLQSLSPRYPALAFVLLKLFRQACAPMFSTKVNIIRYPADGNGRVIFSGIQPTGIPHLGNYLGALREWVRLQNEATGNTKLFFSIADLHSLTVPQEAARLREWRKQSFATLLAVGLEPARCVLFHQSAVSHNAHLCGPAVATLFIA